MFDKRDRRLAASLLVSGLCAPLGLVFWGWQNRRWVDLRLVVAFAFVTVFVAVGFFLGLIAPEAGQPKWYGPLLLANMLAVVFLGTRAFRTRRYAGAVFALYYLAISVVALSTAVFLSYAHVRLAAKLPALLLYPHLLLVGLWVLLFVVISVRYPPWSELDHWREGTGAPPYVH